MAKLSNNSSGTSTGYVNNAFGVVLNIGNEIRLEDGTKVTIPHPLSHDQVLKVLSLLAGDWSVISSKSSSTTVSLDEI